MEASVLKKIICLILVLSFFVATTTIAGDGTMIGTGATALGTGLGFVFLPMLVGDTSINGPNLAAWLGGGACMALGFGLIIGGAMRGEEYYAMVDNPLLNIVSFGTNGKKTYIGAKFSFR
jgi:hypothetical protein